MLAIVRLINVAIAAPASAIRCSSVNSLSSENSIQVDSVNGGPLNGEASTKQQVSIPDSLESIKCLVGIQTYNFYTLTY